MKHKHKKGFVIRYHFLLVAFFIGLGTFYLSTMDYTFKGYIGEDLFYLQEARDKSYDILIYLSTSAELSSSQAAYALGESGGLNTQPCGTHYGYSLWTSIEPSNKEGCTPSKETVLAVFLKETKALLMSYVDTKNEYAQEFIPEMSDNSISLADGYLIGSWGNPLNIPIGTGVDLPPQPKPVSVEIFENKIEVPLIKQDTPTPITSPSAKTMVKITGVSCSGTCTLDAEAAKKLIDAEKEANKQGFSLDIRSSYRSMEQQIALWEGRTPERYAQTYPDPIIRSKYVANPYAPGAAQRNSHHLGKAVDVRIKGKSKMTQSDWDMLEDAMYRAGWVRYKTESWHFEYRTDRWDRAKAEEQKTGKEVRAIV